MLKSKEPYKRQPVKQIYQENEFTCMVSCYLMVIRSFGLQTDNSVEKLYKLFRSDGKDGCNEYMVVKEIERNNLNVAYRHDLSLSVLERFVKNEGPAICTVCQPQASVGTHSVVVDDANEGSFYVFDPLKSGEEIGSGKYSLNDFDKYWEKPLQPIYGHRAAILVSSKKIDDAFLMGAKKFANDPNR